MNEVLNGLLIVVGVSAALVILATGCFGIVMLVTSHTSPTHKEKN